MYAPAEIPGQVHSSPETLSLRLSFNECHIFIENARVIDKPAFLKRLGALLSNTTDPGLARDLQSLMSKVARLTDDDFQQLRVDAERNAILFPPRYKLPE